MIEIKCQGELVDPKTGMVVRCKYDEMVDVTTLKPSPYQTNKHPQDQVERLAKILKYQGIRRPPTVSNLSGCLATGHGLVEAAKLNGWTQVPVQYQDFEDEDQERAHVTSDNSIALWAELDLALVNALIPDFDPSFNIDLLGIKDFTLDVAEKHGDEDEVGEPPPEPVVKRGELWILGEHRLLIEDCTVKENVERLMAGEKADMVFTDPPYGMNLEGRLDEVYDRDVAEKGPSKRFSENRKGIKQWDANFHIKDSLPLFVEKLKEDGNFFVFPGWFLFWREVMPFFFSLGDTWACRPFIWCKNFAATNLRGKSFAAATEPVVVAYQKGHKWNAKVGTENYDWRNFHQNEGGTSVGHPTSKPVALVQHLVTFGNEGDFVLDPFLGSGSTLIACEKTGRRCFGMEIDPHYGQVIIERFEKYSGKTAKREDGVTLAELKGVQVD